MSNLLAALRAATSDTNNAIAGLEAIARQVEAEKKSLTTQLSNLTTELQQLRFDPSKVKEFWDQPYAIVPKGKDEYFVIAPKFVNFQLGWLEKSVRGWNYFLVNRFMTWLSAMPQDLKDRFKFKPVLGAVVEGGEIQLPPEETDEAWKRYGKYCTKRCGPGRIKIKAGYEFKLLSEMIADGILPFKPKPVALSDLRESVASFKIREYQDEGWTRFKQTGAVGIFWPYGAGKTYFGMHACASLVGDKLIVVPSTTLVEQWTERIKKYMPEHAHEITVTTYNSAGNYLHREFVLVVFDECHRLPANTFAKMATLRAKYRIGLSATPYREDGRTELIFALTGYPVGMDWQALLDAGVVNKPTVTLYLCADEGAKKTRLDILMKETSKTLIYSYWLELGQDIAERYDIPFVSGATKNRLEIMQKYQAVCVSSVGGEGVSLPNLERVIEVGFQFGSRREEGQLMGRLFHSDVEEPEHIILMTDKELESYEKRLYAIQEKGFQIRMLRS